MKRMNLVLALLLVATLPALAIRHIRWGSTGDPLTGLTITRTNPGTADSVKWGYTSGLEKGGFAGVKRSGYSDNFFKYTFPTATPNSTIYYKLYDSQSGTWTAQKTFQTAPPSNANNFTFCALGDSRNGLSVWQDVSNLAKAQNPSFTLYNGDIVDNGGSTSEWNNWFNSGQDYLENNIVYHALGNHDAQSVPTYKNIFELPKANNTNLYYSFKYGNAMFITLNSEDPGNSAQAAWLVSTLAAAAADPSIVWKVISFHRPFYTIGNHSGEMNGYWNTWWKAFDDFGVDLIVNGHDHMYERTKPINRNVSTSSAVSEYGSGANQGRCQIVCGGAGAPLYSGSPTWAIETYKSSYNFCTFNINGNTLTGTTYDNNGTVIDDFTINKTGGITTGIGTNSGSQVFNTIAVYPNPAQSEVTLNYVSPAQGEATVQIFDMTGREVLNRKEKKETDKFKKTYDVSTLASGTYSLQVKMGEQEDNALLIIQK